MPQTEIMVFREANGDVPLKMWLDRVEYGDPKAYRVCVQRILLLSQHGYELRRPLADSLRDGIHELRAKSGRVHYRILYFFHGRNVAILSHGFTKEGAVPDIEIEKAIKRRDLVKSNPNKHIAEWEI